MTFVFGQSSIELVRKKPSPNDLCLEYQCKSLGLLECHMTALESCFLKVWYRLSVDTMTTGEASAMSQMGGGEIKCFVYFKNLS